MVKRIKGTSAQPEKPLCVGAGFRGYLVRALAEGFGDSGRDVGKETGLVAAALSFRGTGAIARKVTGQKVRGVGFQEQAVRRDML